MGTGLSGCDSTLTACELDKFITIMSIVLSGELVGNVIIRILA